MAVPWSQASTARPLHGSKVSRPLRQLISSLLTPGDTDSGLIDSVYGELSALVLLAVAVVTGVEIIAVNEILTWNKEGANNYNQRVDASEQNPASLPSSPPSPPPESLHTNLVIPEVQR
ncbi:uncharacterized protein V6R79_016071 [Siganus canaliculatus]